MFPPATLLEAAHTEDSLISVYRRQSAETGTLRTKLPVGSRRIRAAADIIHTGGSAAALPFQPHFSCVVVWPGEWGAYVIVVCAVRCL